MTEAGPAYRVSHGGSTVLEICAGAGGQALGLEQAGFVPAGLVELESIACDTLRANRPEWPVYESDIQAFSGRGFDGIDLLAGGVPCPPFSIAGKQLGAEDDRDLFPEAMRLVRETRPKAVMLENVRGLATRRFESYRGNLQRELSDMGYESQWAVLNAADFGVPQSRPRWILVALRPEFAERFEWPEPAGPRRTVGGTLRRLMSANGWPGAGEWARRANRAAPTIVGGSKKHGGPDLGPTRARKEWAELGVDGLGIADSPPDADFPSDASPRLTVEMVARVQGFPPDWKFAGRKTAQHRQVGNAFPPPVARAVGRSILDSLSGLEVTRIQRRLLEEAAGG